MSKTDQIQVAADLIYEELHKRGYAPTHGIALHIAELLYNKWMLAGGPQRHIPAGEIAQRFRARYEAECLRARDIELLAATNADMPLISPDRLVSK